MTLKLEIRRDSQVFTDLASWWNSRPGPSDSPFLRSEWFENWSSAFVTGRSRLEVAIWTRDGQVMAVLPTSSNRLTRGSLSNSHSDVFDLISDGQPETVSAVSAWLRHRPVTRLYRLDGSSSMIPVEHDPGWQVVQRSEAPYADLRGGIDGLRDGMGRNLKKNIGRLERRLSEVGELVYLDNADGELPDAVARCMELEAAGWKGANGTAMLSRPTSARFYHGLVELAREQSWLRLSCLLISGRLVACQLSLDYNGRRFLLKPAYDETMSDLSPGKVLQWKVMQAAIELGLASYEFGGDSERWKLEWSTTTRPRQTVLRFGSDGPGAMVGGPMRLLVSRRAAPASEEDRAG
jgi:CelD/BcsL family acetyltransferase involved in cellulose biosynthesis